MRAYRLLPVAASLAAFMSGAAASAGTRDCGCCGVVLNGCLNTADFDGGVGYGADDGGSGGGGYATSHAYASASAVVFARAHAQGVAFSQRGRTHGGHGGGMRGGWGGGGRR